MAGTKHTAGPWTATDNSWEVSSVYGPDDCLIAEVHIHPSVTEHNQHELEPVKEANARLIATVPDLLASLKVAVQLAEVASDWNLSEVEIDGEMVSIYDLITIFQAVVAKAEASHV